MYTKLSLSFITLSLATIAGNCAPLCPTYLDVILKDIGKLQQLLPDNGATLYMPNRTGRICANGTIKHFKKELDILSKENADNNTTLTTIQNIQDNIDAAWSGIEEGDEKQDTRELSLGDAFKEIITFLQQCFKNQTNSTTCNN